MDSYELREPRAQQPTRRESFHDWTFPDGTTSTEFFRTDSGYLLRFPRLADFELVGDSLAVACHPAPGVAKATCDHLFLNQVLPLALSCKGKLVFHASAVDADGQALAFLGASGHGKSTLAAAFAKSGAPVLTDDGLQLEPDGGGFRVVPLHPSIRLWQDSRAALLGPEARIAPPLPYTDKERVLAGSGIPFCAQSRPLGCAYFLGDGSVAAPSIIPLGPAESVAEWVRHSFLLDLEERPVLAAHFDRVAGLAERVRCYRLDYPRHYEELPSVRQAILCHLREEAVAA